MQITFLTRKSALIYRRQRVTSLTLNCNGDFAIRAYCGQCVVVRWLCVTMRYSRVERAGPTLCTRRRSLCASGFVCMHKTARGARRMDVLARRTPAMRRARWTNARHTRLTRGAHPGHALCVRRLRSSAHIAHRERTPSVLLTHVQRAQRSSGVFLACAWHAQIA